MDFGHTNNEKYTFEVKKVLVSAVSIISGKMCTTEAKPLFRELTAEDPEPEVAEIESLCAKCTNGTTRLLLTRIPYFKNVAIMSLSCEACGFENNEIWAGGAFAALGVRWKLRVESSDDLNRQVVKSDYTSVCIPELDFEIPAQCQKGEVTTVEGIITRAIAGLMQDQETRKVQHADAAVHLDAFVQRLQDLKTLKSPSTLQLEDVSGNCVIECPKAPKKVSSADRTDFKRNRKQNHLLGIYTHEQVSGRLPGTLTPANRSQERFEQLMVDEVLQFRTNCPDCNVPAETNMKMTNIPHFKEVRARHLDTAQTK